MGQGINGRAFGWVWLALAVMALLVGPAGAARAASSYYVSVMGGNDAFGCTQSHPCQSVGRAVDVAVDGDTIEIADGMYYENLVLFKRLTLRGAGVGKTYLDGIQAGRVLDIQVTSGAGNQVVLENLTIRNGEINEIGLGGAGVLVRAGSLVLRNVVVRANQVKADAAGGGILCLAGTVELIVATIFDNLAPHGGGVSVSAGCVLSARDSTIYLNRSGSGAGLQVQGTADLSNVTVSQNVATEPLTPVQVRAGGIEVEAGGSALLDHVTLTYNQANDAGDAWQLMAKGQVTLSNTLVYSGMGPDCLEAGGEILSNGYNLSGGSSCGLSGPGDLQNRDPLLVPVLAENGGATRTHALQANSPAVDGGGPSGTLPFDQRGLAYRDGDFDGVVRADIGAYEYQPAVVWLPLILR